MPKPNAGVELATDAGGELHNPAAVSELERAVAALGDLTAVVEKMQIDLAKGTQPEADSEPTPQTNQEPAPAVDVGKAGTAAKTVREVAERAMSLAKELEMDKPDMGKATKEIKDLVTMLNALIEKYPGVAKQEEANAAPAGPTLGTVANAVLALAGKVDAAEALGDDHVGAIDGVINDLRVLAGSLQVQKAEGEPKLPDVFAVEEASDKQLLGGVYELLRDTASRVATAAGLQQAGELTDTVKSDLGQVWARLEKARESLPTRMEKASRSLSKQLREISLRALDLSRRSDRADFTDKRALRDLHNVSQMVNALAEKYAKVHKSEAFETTDLAALLNADMMLNQFEAQLEKLEIIEPKVAEAPAAAAQAAPAAPAAEPTASNVPAAAEDDHLKGFSDKLQALTSQVTQLQATIAKARGTVGQSASEGGSEEPIDPPDELLFPSNYNDPSYRDALKQRGIE